MVDSLIALIGRYKTGPGVVIILDFLRGRELHLHLKVRF